MKKIKIKNITKEEASKIIETREPLGLFYLITVDAGKTIFVGIDNSTGDAWTEDFKSFTKCKKWLLSGRNGGC